MAHTVVLVPGDGIGPEITGAVLSILEAAEVPLEWQRETAGVEALGTVGDPLPESLLKAIDEHRVCLKGPVTTPVGTGFRSVNVSLRKHFDLFANLRPVQTIPGLETHHGPVDLVIVRENTEDLYSGLEQEVVPGVVTSLKVITEKACTRISEFAFAYARRHNRKRITAVHKANIMKMSDGLFLNCARKVKQGFYEIEFDDVIVDNAAMQLVMNPRKYDMLLLENLYGDIISDLAAGLIGGLGLCPGANLGPGHAIFEAVHGSAPDIAGKGIANPTGLLLAALMMLRHLDLNAEADRINAALRRALAEPGNRTRDLGGEANTAHFAEAVVREIAAGAG